MCDLALLIRDHPLIYFLVLSQDIMDQKLAGAKKVAKEKNHFFHARQPREGIF